MRFPGTWPGQGQPVNMTTERQQTTDVLRMRGTAKIPQAPRDLIAQAGPRGVLLTWGLPITYSDIVGWRVYKTDENTLYTEMRDRGNRQCFVEATAATASVVSNFFVSSMNALGKESQKIQVQKAPTNEAGAPSMPGTPPGYTSYSNNMTNNYGHIRGAVIG